MIAKSNHHFQLRRQCVLSAYQLIVALNYHATLTSDFLLGSFVLGLVILCLVFSVFPLCYCLAVSTRECNRLPGKTRLRNGLLCVESNTIQSRTFT